MRLFHGDCLEKIREIGDGTIDSIVTDPPYGLSFMGKDWDHGVPGEAFWREALRVAKPGAHLLAFGGTRTYHRLACAIEDAGWEIRDCVMWVYGSGFPKSLDVSKAIDKAAGAERDVIGYKKLNERDKKVYTPNVKTSFVSDSAGENDAGLTGQEITTPATAPARQWSGWGTALKPAWEPIILARKPIEGTVAANVLAHGTGALNIDGCRVGPNPGYSYPNGRGGEGWHGRESLGKNLDVPIESSAGRWPANLIHDGSPEVVGLFPVTGASKSTPRNNGEFKSVAKGRDLPHVTHGHDDNGGSAARFFYCAKASKRDRDEGNNHPTVKPTALMRYLCRLVTPPGGVVLDPFMGSGSTGKAAVLEGFDFAGVEKEVDYIKIAEARIAKAKAEKQEQLL